MSNHRDFDYSQYNYPDRIWIRIPTWEMAVKMSFFIPLLLFGLLANYIIIRLIILNRSLRTPTNLIIANLAVANFLTLLISPTLFMINDFYQNYQLGCIGCRMEGFLEGSFLVTAVFNLSVVSYERLMAIAMPTEARLTIRGAKIIIFVTWMAGLLIALPLAIYRSYKVRHWKNFTEICCKENPKILPKYWYVLITIMVWLPLGIMLICYSAIFYKLDRYEKRNLSREHPLAVSYKKTVAKTLFIVVIVFIVLRVPFTILVVLRNKTFVKSGTKMTESFQICFYISQYLMFLNAAINPLIYGFNNDNFRRAYDQTPLFTCWRKSQETKDTDISLPKERKTNNCCKKLTCGITCIPHHGKFNMKYGQQLKSFWFKTSKSTGKTDVVMDDAKICDNTQTYRNVDEDLPGNLQNIDDGFM